MMTRFSRHRHVVVPTTEGLMVEVIKTRGAGDTIAQNRSIHGVLFIELITREN